VEIRTSDERLPSPEETTDPAETPVDVLYIAGEGRSGSTLLSRMLPGSTGFAAGEVRYVWERGLGEDRDCECGRPFASCTFWSKVVERLEQRVGPQVRDVTSMVEADHRLLRTRRARQAMGYAGEPAAWRDQEPEYAARISALYQVIREVARRPLVIDSSKLPMYGLLLRGDAALRVSVIHLVRDPRAAAHSWRRTKRVQDSRTRSHMRRRGLVHSCGVWNSSNYLAEALLRRGDTPFVRVRYEDLVKRPRETIEGIGAALGMELDTTSVGDGEVLLTPGHAASGNPDRHVSGSVPLRLDEAWRTEMPRLDKALVGALTFPVARRYGYV
jgi:hypothetical protein